jgi:hypothetical protein
MGGRVGLAPKLEEDMATVTRAVEQKSVTYSLDGLQRKIIEAKMAIDEELGRATDMDFRANLVITVNSLRKLEEQILRRS